MVDPHTQKTLSSIASLRAEVSSVRVLSFVLKLPTSKRFQIGCESATNQEAEREKLYKCLVPIRYFIAPHVLGTKRALASDHSDE
jgi:hypothetical protein